MSKKNSASFLKLFQGTVEKQQSLAGIGHSPASHKGRYFGQEGVKTQCIPCCQKLLFFFVTGKYYNWESSYKVSFLLMTWFNIHWRSSEQLGRKSRRTEEEKNSKSKKKKKKRHKSLESITNNPEIRWRAAPGRSVSYKLWQIIYCEGQTPEKSLELFPLCRICFQPSDSCFHWGCLAFPKHYISFYWKREHGSHRRAQPAEWQRGNTQKTLSESLNPLKYAEKSPMGRIRQSIKYHRKITLGVVDAELRLVMRQRKKQFGS